MRFQNHGLIFFHFSLAFVFTKQTVSNDDDKLGTIVAANVVFRHGHRTPTKCYPKDPYNNLSYWPEGWGELTNIGKMQEYELGRWLRQRFNHLLSEIYTRDEIHIVSTDVDRTLMSAEASLAGLYLPKDSQRWSSDIKWQPIPVHTVPEHLDSILAMGAPCPKYNLESKRVMELPQIVDLMASFNDLLEYLTEHTGEKVTDLVKVQNIWSTLHIETLHSYKLPEWTDTIYPNPIKTAAAHIYSLQTYSPEQKRLKSGPLLKDMLQHFKLKLGDSSYVPDNLEEAELIKKQKVWLYSGHDETLGSLLNSLNLYNLINPPFASAVLIELREKDGNNFITVTYHNSTTEPPYLLTIPGCSELCPYKTFIELTHPIIPYDWFAECHPSHRIYDLTTELPYNSLAVFVMVTSTLLVFLLLASMSIFWQKQKPTRFYRKLKPDSI
ncbi:prostatic acid phosphatase-like [Lycorma delicatula]|uniref:prostatic acid phosphatase-like n=1 Tax=Lycorma delicatula TaxID=130591 RepID=UPI003F512B7F